MPQPAAGQFSGIFICYRRGDSGGHAGRLYDRLTDHFGDTQVFMDIDRLEPGENFVQAIEAAVGSCEVLLALIGRGWLDGRDETGRRLDNPDDFVRLELSAALARGIQVVPVLVQGAQMPRPQDLPEDLSALSHRHALELSDQRWRHDVDRLIGALEKIRARRHEEEAERRRLEEEARQAEENERLNQTAAESERQRRETAGAERGRRETEEQSTPARAARSEPPAVPPRRTVPGSLIAVVVLALVAAGLAWAVWRARATGEKSVPATNQVQNDNAGGGGNKGRKADITPPPGMVYVPGGEFMMGRDDGDEYERPAHREPLKAFFIDAYEVTCDDYEKFVREESHPPPPGWKGRTCPAGAARKPVAGVTWGDAVAFCYTRSKKLPTEQEWEFAARGADGRRYPWGDEWLAGLANADGASGGVVDVGSYQGGKSPFGAFDMVGNVWEWTTATLSPYPPKRVLPIKVTSDLKVIRGGSFAENRAQATATYRGYLSEISTHNEKTGFRCAKDAADAPGQ